MLAKLFSKKNVQQTGQIVGLQVTQSNLIIVRIEKTREGKNLFLAHETITCTEADQFQLLQNYIEVNGLQDTTTHMVLAHKNYQLLMVDAPEGQDKEALTSLKWKLKDLIDFPIDEASVGYFEIPVRRASDDQKLAFAVVAKSATVLAQQTLAMQAGLKVRSIDISELAQRNLVIASGKGQEPTAVLRLTPRGGSLIYMREELLYMHRQFELPIELILDSDFDDSEEAKSLQENLALEIQRSIDYCASYLRQPQVSEILLMPIARESPKFLDYIQQTLGTPIRMLDLNDIFETTEKISRENQARLLLAFGAALRLPEDKK